MKTSQVMLCAFAAVSLAGVLMLYALPWPGNTLKEINVTSVGFGPYHIGAGKAELLADASLEFNADKPNCHGWVRPASLSEGQRGCLLTATAWEAGAAGTEALCPTHSDPHTTLIFANDRLAKVNVRCTRPE
jgi:hypothetical protein